MDAADERALRIFRGPKTEERFSHADHVRVARLYLAEFPVHDAIGRFGDDLLAFARRQGAERIFHRTITTAFLLLIADRMARSRAASYADLLAAFPELSSAKCLEAYYAPETLASPLAKETFLFPDRLITSMSRRG